MDINRSTILKRVVGKEGERETECVCVCVCVCVSRI